MSGRPAASVALCACALTMFIGCSRSPAPAAGDVTRPSTAGSPPRTACENQTLTVQDVAGILVAPVTAIKGVSEDPQTCEYSTGSFPAIIVSVRPGRGKTTVESWTSGRMPLKASPLPGVGEAAAWQSSLHEVIAEKGDVLCDVQVRGGVTDIALTMETLAGALGALCNKIFAAG